MEVFVETQRKGIDDRTSSVRSRKERAQDHLRGRRKKLGQNSARIHGGFKEDGN